MSVGKTGQGGLPPPLDSNQSRPAVVRRQAPYKPLPAIPLGPKDPNMAKVKQVYQNVEGMVSTEVNKQGKTVRTLDLSALPTRWNDSARDSGIVHKRQNTPKPVVLVKGKTVTQVPFSLGKALGNLINRIINSAAVQAMLTKIKEFSSHIEFPGILSSGKNTVAETFTTKAKRLKNEQAERNILLERTFYPTRNQVSVLSNGILKELGLTEEDIEMAKYKLKSSQKEPKESTTQEAVTHLLRSEPFGKSFGFVEKGNYWLATKFTDARNPDGKIVFRNLSDTNSISNHELEQILKTAK